MAHHGRALERLTGDTALVRALRQDPETAPLGARSRALVTFSLALTRTPHAMTEQHVSILREAGIDDRGIHDAVAVVGYFNFVNRLASGLGVPLEEDFTNEA